MASLPGHLAICVLYWLFPGEFSLLGLIIGSLILDMDSGFALMRGLKKLRRSTLKSWKSFRQYVGDIFYLNAGDEFHNLLGILLISPVGVLSVLYLQQRFSLGPDPLGLIIGSILVGALSHIILDVPAHRRLRYFTPFEKRQEPLVVLFRGSKIFQRIYPHLEAERSLGLPEYHSLPFFIYHMGSYVFPLISLALFCVISLKNYLM